MPLSDTVFTGKGVAAAIGAALPVAPLIMVIVLWVAMCPTAAQAGCVDPPTGLAAWWGGDGNAGDVFGTYPGSRQGDTAFVPGLVGEAFSFDGTGDRVDVTGANLGNLGGAPFTVAFWLKPAVSPVAQAYLVGRSNPDAGQGWDIRQEGLGLRVVGVDGWAVNIVTTDVLTIGEWHHVALTGAVDAGSGDEVVLWVDGAVAGSCGRSSVGPTSNPLRFGMTTNFGGAAFEGLLDEVQLYDRALSGGEVATLVAAGADGCCRPCAAQPPGTAGWWRGEDDASDELGVNDGSAIGGLTYADGLVGRAFSTDGSTSAVVLPDSDLWDFGTGSFSILAWFRSGTAGYRNLVRYHDGGSSSGFWGVRLESTGRIQLLVAANLASLVTITSDAAVADDSWHMVAAVRDAAAGELRLYVDGVAAASPVAEPGLNVVASAGTLAAIGALVYPGGANSVEHFAGLIDEVAVVAEALGASEAERLFNATASGICHGCAAATAGRVSWWRAEDTAEDSIGGNDGALMNSATYAPGKVGEAFSLDFDSVQDRVEIPHDPSLSFAGGQPMSFDLWARRSSDATPQHLLSKRLDCLSTPWNYQLWWDRTADELCFGSLAGEVCTTADRLPLAVWTHLGFTFDGGTGTLWVDGEPVASAAMALGPDTGSPPLRLGDVADCEAYGLGFRGLLDEVEIHDRALFRDEVYAIHAAGGHGTCTPPDTTPDPFEFTDQNGLAPETVATSDEIVVSGIDVAAPVAITACTSTSCEYSVNSGDWTGGPGVVTAGDAVRVRQTAAASYGTTTDLTLDIGGVEDTFSVSTLAQHTLTVTLAGDGGGTVTSDPAGVDCPGSACAAAFVETELVTLTATAGPDSLFTGWSGDPDCADGEVQLATDVACTATFALELVFHDGFESGDTGQWSSVSP